MKDYSNMPLPEMINAMNKESSPMHKSIILRTWIMGKSYEEILMLIAMVSEAGAKAGFFMGFLSGLLTAFVAWLVSLWFL